MREDLIAERRRLSAAQKAHFVREGFVRIDRAFSRKIAAEARAILWRDTGCSPDDRSTWIHPVVRLGDYAQAPFREAANTRVLHDAFDDLVGENQWLPRTTLGTFPIRFPHPDDPGDTGWHVDASFPPDNGGASFLDWRINVNSKGRALLMLFLFSDVGEKDAPTRIRAGSHLPVARALAVKGEAGMSALELGAALDEISGGMPEALAMGEVGTVYLCPPFSCSRGPVAPWRLSAIYGAATAVSKGRVRFACRRWRVIPGRISDSAGVRVT